MILIYNLIFKFICFFQIILLPALTLDPLKGRTTINSIKLLSYPRQPPTPKGENHHQINQIVIISVPTPDP